MLFGDHRLELKTHEQVRAMRVSGLVVGRTLERLRAAVRPGVSTAALDALAEESIRDQGGVPSFLGYGEPPFPASICASVNDQVVHGIPGARVLEQGDVISIDCGAIVDHAGQGWHGDAAITVAVGEVRPEVAELMRVTEEALWRGIAAARSGGRLGDISHAIESCVDGQDRDYGIVDGYTGHGIGTSMHMDPDVPNYGRPGRGPRLRPGVALAVEPMVTLGTGQTDVDPDEWTVVTTDGSWAAHFEHTFALTEAGAWVLTAEDGGRARLTELGVPFGGED